MRKILLPLLALTVLGTGPSQGGGDEQITRLWVHSVQAHKPGTVDEALRDVASFRARDFEIIRDQLRSVLRREVATSTERNDLLRRGALLHTDIVLLLPDLAGNFPVPQGQLRAPGSSQPLRPRLRLQSDQLVMSKDGEYVNSLRETGHWGFASWLLQGIEPDAAKDEFVHLWYRAIAAMFQNVYLLGSGTYHMERALQTLPSDPIILLYAGAMCEALASPRFQNIPLTAKDAPQTVALPSAEEQRHTAEHFLREAVKTGAPPEAALRLGRVLGDLGRHTDAITVLQQLIPPDGDRRLDYLRSLFLGTELGSVGKVDLARESFDRAISLYPTAEAPLVAMSEMYRRAGRRAAALEALQRLEQLPEPKRRLDPWTDYHHSYAADADDQLAAVYAWVDKHRAVR
jgi:tetratricopeptide (TPR) repeat protein